MSAVQIRNPSVRRRTLWRLLWAAVLLLHAPATLNAVLAMWRLEHSGPSSSSIILLAASNAFFIFEICFACSFRLISNRRSAAVFVLVVLMLHVGVIEQRLPRALPNSQLLYCLLLTALGACEWRRLLETALAPNRSERATYLPRAQAAWRIYGRRARDQLDPRPPRLVLSLDSPRPPPVKAVA
jgi:hypothetical protein